MKIHPNSQSGALLREMGVPAENLDCTRFLRWRWQKGGAITLAIPFGGAVVLARDQYLPRDPTGREIAVGRNLAILRHELEHVTQRRKWGFLRYVYRHVRARIQTRSILAQDSDVEKPCYIAQYEADRFLDARGIT